LENLFEWGSVTKVDEQHPGRYRGKEIQLTQQDGKLIYKVTQKKCLGNLDEGRINPGRLQQEPKLTADEWKEMRSVCGCLQWIAGQTRPDVASTASLSHRGQNTDIHDLKKIPPHCKVCRFKATADSGLVFPAIPFGRSSVIVTFADSGWANEMRFASQFGVMVTLCPAQVREKATYGFALDWKSGRSPRICRSTLAAEACAADEGTDRSCYGNMFLTELLFHTPAHRGDMKFTLTALHVTDAKSLSDCLVVENTD